MDRANTPLASYARRGSIALLAVAAVAAVAFVLAPRPAAAGFDDRALILSSTEGTSTATATPLPSQMATTGVGCKQLIIVTAAKLGDTTGTLQVFNKVGDTWVATLTVSARLGKHGVMDGKKRKAGNNTTPTGIWAMPNYVFGVHSRAPLGSKMKFRKMDKRSWWSSKHGKTYNTWVEARHWTGEHIGLSKKAYEFAVSTGYNAKPNPVTYGRGTAIFLHVGHPGLTAGCVEVSRANMIRICKLLDRSKHPHFAIGTLKAGTKTSIWAY